MNQKEFVAALAAQVSKQTFPDYVKESPAKIAAKLTKDAEVFISGELGKGKPKNGQSKVGGKPDVPADFEWPTEEEDDDAPLQFFAQINLAEVHPHDFENKLPAEGMLWFFSIADGDRAGGGEIDESTTKVIYAAKPGKLKAHDIPEAIAENEDAEIDEHILALGPCIGLDAFRDSGIKNVINEQLRALGGKSGPLFMLNVRDEEDGIMLADFDCYAIAKNAFGEGILGFMLTEEDLENGELDKAETLFDGGT
ncbi:MAG: YwqG family protein [Polyangiaceae bacterium]